jgi:hypothetical protein
MVAGQHPPGWPLNLDPKRDVPDNQRGASDCDTVDRTTRAVFGHDVRFHPITKLPLQSGSGHCAQSDDEQALTIHLPLIAQRDGVEAAQAMRAKLTKAPAEVIENAVAEREGTTTH